MSKPRIIWAGNCWVARQWTVNNDFLLQGVGATPGDAFKNLQETRSYYEKSIFVSPDRLERVPGESSRGRDGSQLASAGAARDSAADQNADGVGGYSASEPGDKFQAAQAWLRSRGITDPKPLYRSSP